MLGRLNVPAPVPRGSTTPRAIAGVLRAPATFLVARILLASAYLLGAIVKLLDWPGAVAEQAHFGLSPAGGWAALTILTELAGSLLLLSRRFVWLGAGMLGVFTVLAAVIANAFWTMPPGPARFAATNAFFEHLGLVGGFMAVAALAEHVRRNA